SAEVPYLAIREVGPNPITSQITVWYATCRRGTVRVDLYDVSGRVVRTLAHQAVEPGENVLKVYLASGGERAVAPGVYFVRLSLDGQSQARKVVIAE
ncbi:MAG: T9SS type A sorting domain-containing protein, partial [bacterium]